MAQEVIKKVVNMSSSTSAEVGTVTTNTVHLTTQPNATCITVEV